MSPQVASLYFRSEEYWAQIEAGATGTGQPNFNGSKLAALFVPIGSIADQRRAELFIGRAFTWIDLLISEATSARKLIDHLDRAVLAKAFRGELVPQDPTDEPAGVLLERIRAQRDGDNKQRARRSAKT